MSTAITYETSKDGWSLFYHYLSNGLLVISASFKSGDIGNIDEYRNELRENLEGIIISMVANNHQNVANKMHEILKMISALDLGDIKNHELIFAKYDEYKQV